MALIFSVTTNKLLATAVEAANIARNSMGAFGREPALYKTDRDFSTAADLGIELAVKEYLKAATPEISFMGEETSLMPEGNYWCLDPIDGTVNFSRGIPQFAFSLAYVCKNQPIVGVIDLPMTDERFTAINGQGAFLNGKKIICSSIRRLDKSIISLGDFSTRKNSDELNGPRISLLEKLTRKSLRLRMFGSAAIDLAYLAAGRTDAVVLASAHPWDIAAGVLIAREAGAQAVTAAGAEYNAESLSVLACTPGIATEFLYSAIETLKP